MKVLILILSLITLITFTGNVFADEEELERLFDMELQREKEELERKYKNVEPFIRTHLKDPKVKFCELKNTDSFFCYLAKSSDEILRQITGACGVFPSEESFSYWYIVNFCQRILNSAFSGSSFSPGRGGIINSGGVQYYLSPAAAYFYQVTKIVSPIDIPFTAIPQGIKYIVSIATPEGGRAQFHLDHTGITEISYVDFAFNIEQAFVKNNIKITKKQLIFELLDYYRFVKSYIKDISSYEFMVSILTSAQEQEAFVDFALKKTKRK